MLKQLYISNFALIHEMDVSFPGKLTVITGETGAGKSIFLEALGLVLGNRADLVLGKWEISCPADSFIARFRQIQLKMQQNLTFTADDFGRRNCQNLINYLTFTANYFSRHN